MNRRFLLLAIFSLALQANLHDFVVAGDLNGLRRAIDAAPDAMAAMEEANGMGWNVVRHAVEINSLDIVQELVQRGALGEDMRTGAIALYIVATTARNEEVADFLYGVVVGEPLPTVPEDGADLEQFADQVRAGTHPALPAPSPARARARAMTLEEAEGLDVPDEAAGPRIFGLAALVLDLDDDELESTAAAAARGAVAGVLATCKFSTNSPGGGAFR